MSDKSKTNCDKLVMLSIINYFHTEETQNKFLSLQTFLIGQYSIHSLKFTRVGRDGYLFRALIENIPFNIYGDIDPYIVDELRKLHPLYECVLTVFNKEQVYAKYIDFYPQKGQEAQILQHPETADDYEISFDEHAQNSDSSPEFEEWLDQIFLANQTTWTDYGSLHLRQMKIWIDPDVENDHYTRNFRSDSGDYSP